MQVNISIKIIQVAAFHICFNIKVKRVVAKCFSQIECLRIEMACFYLSIKAWNFVEKGCHTIEFDIGIRVVE